ncbi:MAG: FG-GAP repeat domain-containing protein [Planctomycetota bacterium]|jgi:hypothetical protein
MKRLAACTAWMALAMGALSAADPYQVTTPGKPGEGGVVPLLSGSGPGVPGTVHALLLDDARPDTTATLVVGFSALAAPFKGGVLGPSPDLLVSGLPTDAGGALALPFILPASAPPGLTLWMQAWISDAAASAGLSASNTLAFTVQAPPAPLYDAGAAIVAAMPDGPAGVAAGDVDGDGLPDLVVRSVGPDLLLVLRGLGDGTAAPAPLAMLPDDGVAFTLADLDDDGDLDLVSTGSLADTVRVRLGHGDGSFAAGVDYATGHLSVDVITHDVDGDGVLDVVTADAAGTTSVLLGRGGGDGKLERVVSHVVGFNPTHVAAGDLDGDGEQDLAVSYNAGFGRVAVLYGRGEAAFAAPVIVPAGQNPADLVIEDFDGNGQLDIAVTHISSDDVHVILGQGGGVFGPGIPHPLPPGTQPRTLACADLDEDGVPDLVVARFGGLSVLRGIGDGRFLPEEVHAFSGILSFGLTIADLDLDGLLDLVTTRLTDDEVLVLLHL